MTLMTSTLIEQVPATMIMLSIFCSIGIIGNTIVIVIYSTKHDRLTSTVFILALAMVDSFACVCLMPMTMYIESVEWRIQSEFLCKFYYVVNNSFIPFSSLLISGIAFDRYFAICHPFLKVFTVNRAKYIIGAMLLTALLLGGVSSITIVVRQTMPAGTVTPEFECTEIRMLNTSKAQMIVYRIVQGSQISSYVVCILSVVLLYILIFRSVLIMRKKRTRLIGNKQRKLPQPPESVAKHNQTNCVSFGNDCVQDGNGRTGTETKAGEPPEVAEKDLVSEIWKTRLNLATSGGARAPSTTTKPPSEERNPPKKGSEFSNREDSSSHQAQANSEKNRRISTRNFKGTALLQNLKTAAMLFVVAVAYILALIPAMLMAIGVVKMYLPIFYMYYVNNAINPIIYCFMNPTFREDVHNFFIARFRNLHKPC